MKLSFFFALALAFAGCSLMAAIEARDSFSAASSAVVNQVITIPNDGPSVFQVSSAGEIKPLKMAEESQWGNTEAAGSNDPLLSRDGSRLAIVRKGSISISAVSGDDAVTVIKGQLDKVLLITGWSPNGRQLVYYMAPSPENNAPLPQVTVAKHFIYEVDKKISREITVGGKLCGWLPNGDLLVYDEEKGRLLSQPLVANADAKVILTNTGVLAQISLYPDGDRIAANRSKMNNTSSSELVSVELASGKVTSLNPPGMWAEFQWPKWSPSGKQMAWLKRVSTEKGIPKSVVVVEGKQITPVSVIVKYMWLSEGTLAIIQKSAIVVIDTAGNELGRKVVGASD